MEDRKYYVFRVCYEEPYYKLMNEAMQAGVLRQGWGMQRPGMAGMDARKSEEEFARAWRENFEDGTAAGTIATKYRQLRMMTEFKAGDILVVPKVPREGMFAILEVAAPYTFQQEGRAFAGDGIEDFRHCIPVKMKCRAAYNNSANSRTVSAKFRSYQSCVNRVYNEEFITAAEDILRENTAVLDSESKELEALDIWREDAFAALAKALIQKICNWTPRATEAIVCRLFESNGYRCIGKNRYDREGGDIDLLFTMPGGRLLEDVMELRPAQNMALPKINVQVKNKKGRDKGDVAGVRQLMKMSSAEVPSIDILISTADDFTPECKKLAGDNGVLLVNGRQLVELLMKHGLAGKDA